MSKPTEADAQAAIKTLLEFLDPEPDRVGLEDTPKRVVAAWREWTSGYADDPEKILSKSFDDVEGYDQLIVVPNIRVVSHCEHHLATIEGVAHVGYIPGQSKRVLGLSKIPRLVECFARRLQTQERMTKQIADALMKHAGALGVAVVIKSGHQCMGTRGVMQPSASMITSATLGALRDRPEARAEFLSLISLG